ncbi:type II toxin-antitoxin system RelB/DinJ family antitoxin [Lacticaseibacillus sp. 866-1]|uniref:type II toxin-antitoxin system RelB/DinJ family antitoxin n=1 Tax=Lacticaseibacillus sp. 866-1 TaxID=2799576 RepID=UPI001944E042|nr:type II toxin-antitoxin system RelB/DinJ family antitoxin [Lacticaseibacillus sp. 866-1]
MRLQDQTVRVFARLDPKTKADAEEALAEMGFTLTSAITVFLRQVARDKKFPFTPDTGYLAEIGLDNQGRKKKQKK